MGITSLNIDTCTQNEIQNIYKKEFVPAPYG